jgi:serine protease
VLDTGIDSRHPDLQGKVLPGYDVSTGQTIAVGTHTDLFSHGTHVAGILAAQTDNAMGVAGVSWSAKILPVKVLDATGYGSYSDASEGIVWAVDHGAQVLNLSLGGPAGSDTEVQTIRAAIDYAWGRGVLGIAAAGNEGCGADKPQYPAGFCQVDYPGYIDSVVAVASLDQSDTRSSFSNYYPYVDVAAPGRAIYSTLPNGTYGTKSGTSMSTPMVSGMAALLLALDPTLTPTQLTQRIISSTTDLGPAGHDIYYGWGRVSAAKAVLSTAIDVQASHITVVPGANGAATLTIASKGAGTVNWQAVSDVPWLTVGSGNRGKVSAQGISRVSVTADPALTPATAVTGTIRIGALHGSELVAPQTVRVDLIRGRVHLPEILRGKVG